MCFKTVFPIVKSGSYNVKKLKNTEEGTRKTAVFHLALQAAEAAYYHKLFSLY